MRPPAQVLFGQHVWPWKPHATHVPLTHIDCAHGLFMQHGSPTWPQLAVETHRLFLHVRLAPHALFMQHGWLASPQLPPASTVPARSCIGTKLPPAEHADKNAKDKSERSFMFRSVSLDTAAAAHSFRSSRAMMFFWISDEPAPMTPGMTSRRWRSTSISRR